MISFRDMTFCAAPCANQQCQRAVTTEVRLDGIKWWGNADFPIALADFSPGCDDYQPIISTGDI